MESSQNSVLVDPLSDFSLVSFFPRTFNQLGFDPDPNIRHNDPLEAVGAHLESMVLKNPNRLLEQAKRILDGGLESLNGNNLVNDKGEDTIGNFRGEQRDPENLKTASDEDTVGDLLGGNHENVQARRPALGRKRSRFSLKPNSSQSTESLKPFVDIDKLPDPEEFFSAFEKHENAKNELRRQTGKPLMDLDQNVPHMAEKRHRPGLLRKSASYKHCFSMGPSSDAKTFFSSQETLSQDLCSQSPSNHCLQTDHTGQESAGKERSSNVNDELQSSPDKDDESDELIGILQKRFKPVEINKSCLPELNSALQSEFMTVGESLHEDKMSDLHAIVSYIAKETTLGCNDVERRSGPHPSTSPKPPKSPHSSISLLKARLFQARQGKDPFSDLDMDLSPDLAAKDVQKSVKDKDARETNLNSILQMELDDENVEHGESDVNPRSPLLNKESDTTHNLETTEDISKTLGVHSDIEMHTELDHCIQRNQSPKPAAPETGSNVVHDNDTRDFDADNLGSSEKTMIDHSMDSGIALNMTPQSKLDNDVMAHSTLGGVLEDNPSKVSDAAAVSVDEHMEPDDGNLQVVEEDVEGRNVEKSNCTMEQSTANAVKDLGEDVNPSGTNDDLDHDRPSTSLARPLKKAKKKASSKKTEHNRSKTRETAEKRAPTARKHTREHTKFSPRKSLAGNHSMDSGIALNMTPGAELDHDIMAHNTIGGVLEDDPSKVSDAAAISVDDHIELDVGALEEDVEGRNVEKANCNTEQSTANAVEDHGEDGHPSGAKHDLDHYRPTTSRTRILKKIQKASSKKTEHYRSKTREPAKKRAPAARKHTRELMDFSRRKSLAACGTQWEAGIRKSTRIRTRPLEFWKGERQLYGRIHEALVTVVGTKYFSPTKEAGQAAAMKVKSYVSDEYKDIVELAALH